MTKIDTVVFDIGNVLIAWDPRNLYRKIFTDPSRMEWFLAHVCTSEWNARQDAGRAWAEAEVEAIARHPELASEIRAFRDRWMEMVAGPIPGMPELFEAVGRAGYRRCAVSNFAADTFEEAAARFPFLAAFDCAIVSGRVGLLKPGTAIFHLLIERCDVDPGRAIYVDDVPENVEAAASVGLHAFLFTDAATFARDLDRLGVRLDLASA